MDSSLKYPASSGRSSDATEAKESSKFPRPSTILSVTLTGSPHTIGLEALERITRIFSIICIVAVVVIQPSERRESEAVQELSDQNKSGISDSIASMVMLDFFSPFASLRYPPFTSMVIRLRSGETGFQSLS